MNVITIMQQFKYFMNNTPDYIHEINTFLLEQKESFYKHKLPLYLKQGVPRDEATNKIRQGWVSTVGKVLEGLVETIISDFCKIILPQTYKRYSA